MKIYTKRGDQGQTDLYGGARVSKAHPRVIAYGLVDAANSAIGFAAVCSGELQPALAKIISMLFDIGAELASVSEKAPQMALISTSHVAMLESWIDQADGELPAIKNFVLPTGCELAARFHLARTAVRIAEQQVIALGELGEPIRPEIIQYLNRLSDLMFTWARWANIKSHTKEVLWVKN